MSLDSWMHATRMDLEWRREEISRWEFWMPLQLNCRMAPSEWSGWGGGEGGSIGEEGGGEEGGVEEGMGRDRRRMGKRGWWEKVGEVVESKPGTPNWNANQLASGGRST